MRRCPECHKCDHKHPPECRATCENWAEYQEYIAHRRGEKKKEAVLNRYYVDKSAVAFKKKLNATRK